MKTYHNEKKWIWQSANFPKFVFEKVDLSQLYYKFGQLNMIEEFMDNDNSKELVLDILSNEAIATSQIEGEILQRSSVRSSVNKILKLGLDDDYSSTVHTDALVDIIVDAKQNSSTALTKERICRWHKALFPTGQSGIKEINVGSYRTDIEDMQIVSGSWEKEKVHYVAPSSTDVGNLMDYFLLWINSDTQSNVIYKAAIAHLWFLLIHPYDDGNGRIARAISDFVLSQGKLANTSFYSVSSIISSKRKEYYDVLDKVCVQTDLEINVWIEWFIDLIFESIDDTLIKVETVKTKSIFWNKHQDTVLNERQKKVILKMLTSLPNEFEGGMKVKKYISITKTTRISASRDLSDLVSKGILQSHGKARGIYYTLISNI